LAFGGKEETLDGGGAKACARELMIHVEHIESALESEVGIGSVLFSVFRKIPRGEENFDFPVFN
jgi:hypothetical protein